MKARLCQQRWKDFENGQPEYNPTCPETPWADGEALTEAVGTTDRMYESADRGAETR